MLNAKNFALAAGIFWGAALFVFTLISIYTGYGSVFLDLLADIYPGFNISVGGAFLGLIYGFIDAFVGCYIFVVLYNWLQKKSGKK